ncbi:sensor histidine kinase NtrY-like [Microbaculum marinisediminis]|uniref:histidine kinase n=1 Tax=Microbaculum marinisediminis TaxID=2931392 RepID=A0AAW5R6M1_9HYPH|nr:PAS domain-containing sensor histidine kinase [Microbaculum sp. A6E488]MCT8974165.1 PAS domain-containing sensor histidine kinase [Microbaculum sp. A6E488]
MGALLVVLSLVAGTGTFAVLTGLTAVEPDENAVAAALVVNLILVAGLGAIVAVEIGRLWLARRRGIAGAGLHLRILALFAVIAVVPAVIVAIIASVTLSRGLDTWFSERTKAIMQTSLSVADAYLREHGQVIRADILAMATDLERADAMYRDDPEQFQKFFTAQAAIRSLPAAYLLDENLNVLRRADIELKREFLMPPANAVEQAKSGEVIVIAPGVSNQVGAIKKLDDFDGAYLYVARSVDPLVINYLRLAQANIAEFSSLERRRFGVQIAFGLMYVGFAFILLLAAVWVGMGFANRLVSPVRRLIGAADQVAQGNLYVQVPIRNKEGDLASLSTTFNKMTTQLRSQRDDLLEANEELDERRRFIETVLAGVPAGVLGVDDAGAVSLANRSAAVLLGTSQEELLGKPLTDELPELIPCIEQAWAQPSRLIHDQISVRRGGRDRTIAVRVATEVSATGHRGYVVTLDDITELVTAQRTSAWADVARRIAHEIKNPLTPIQLSAERLKRKYGKAITEDREIFDQCTDTIIRQVGDIGRMVDEFSSFARMPKAVIAPADIVETVKQAAFLMRVGNPEVDISLDLPETAISVPIDRRLISQAVTNIIKNAIEAISATDPDANGERGHVAVTVGEANGWVTIDAIDNGIGLPSENRARLLEPYMTTREKGTGLGLAIVGRIMEEHGGRVELADAPSVAEGGHGAWVRLALPVGGNSEMEMDDLERAVDAAVS